jgi:hypothetical protein
MTKYKVIAYMDTIRMHDKRLCNNTYRNIHCKGIPMVVNEVVTQSDSQMLTRNGKLDSTNYELRVSKERRARLGGWGR